MHGRFLVIGRGSRCSTTGIPEDIVRYVQGGMERRQSMSDKGPNRRTREKRRTKSEMTSIFKPLFFFPCPTSNCTVVCNSVAIVYLDPFLSNGGSKITQGLEFSLKFLPFTSEMCCVDSESGLGSVAGWCESTIVCLRRPKDWISLLMTGMCRGRRGLVAVLTIFPFSIDLPS